MTRSALRILKLLVVALAAAVTTSGAAAKKPPRVVGGPLLAERYWDVTARTERGKVTFVSVARGRAPAGEKVTIQPQLGPMKLVLLGKKQRVLGRFAFAWPLLGAVADSDDYGLAAGLTAETSLRVPHVPGLRRLSIVDEGGKPLATKAARWPGEPADAAPPPSDDPPPEKREPRELVPTPAK